MATTSHNGKRRILSTVVCPHCWTSYAPEDALWIAEAPDLVGDEKLGEGERLRFLPTEFDVQGFAIDSKGYACKDLACPRCHLRTPSSILEAPTVFMSIVGAPASGKSYYLASSTWFLRKILPNHFNVSFGDADPEMNRRLQDYETLQFLGDDDKIVKIEKTEEQGDLYDVVQFDGQNVVYPQPFLFLATPDATHRNAEKAGRLARLICLYDNAGESYLPTRDSDSAALPVTRHLAQSGCIFFLFDPTQDARFRAACRQVSNDPQLSDSESDDAQRRSPLRQESVFAEMAKRVRSYCRLGAGERYSKPLIVVVSKLDVWRELIPNEIFEHEPFSFASYQGQDFAYLNKKRIRTASERVRKLLALRTTEFVAAVDSFAEDVVYIPVSATGVSPTVDPSTRRSGFRSKDIRPIWIVAPMLYALSRVTTGVFPEIPVASSSNGAL